VLTPQLQLALTQTLERGEQAILFLNRRGYAQFVLCLDCGKTVGCPNCSVTLTHHKARGRLLCHYCGYQIRPPSQCERCQGARVVLYGMGTERLEEVVRTLFPSARLARLDRDSTRRRGALLQVLRRFGAGEADILIGTQMLAKGHDYPGVTLVGVIAADVSLAVADFRAAERTYQLLAQVSGRAGRSSLPGQVIIQSFDTEHSVILAAQQHDFKGFADQELAERRTLGYPPYGRLALVRIEAREDEHAETAARTMLKLAAKQLGAGLEILGPAPAPLARLRGVVRYQLLIKAKQNKVLQNALGALESAHAQLRPQQTRLVFDVDPTLVL
jgi:primosomal protein N' (replication factor Y)